MTTKEAKFGWVNPVKLLINYKQVYKCFAQIETNLDVSIKFPKAPQQ